MWVKHFIFLFLFLFGTVFSITFLTSCVNDELPGCGCEFMTGTTVIDTGYVDYSNSYSRFKPTGIYHMCNEYVLGEFINQIVIIDANATIACVNDSISRYMINTVTPYQIEVPGISEEEYEVYLALLKHFYPDTTLFTIWWETIDEFISINPTHLYTPKYSYNLAIEFFYYEKEVTTLDVNGFTNPEVEIVLIDEDPGRLGPEFFETYQGTNGMNYFTRVAIQDNYAMLFYKRKYGAASGQDIHVLLKKDTEGWQVIKAVVWSYFD